MAPMTENTMPNGNPLLSWLASAVVLLMSGMTEVTATDLATITGNASYRERVALRPGAVLEVELLDVSRADAPADRLASIRIRVQGQPPMPFTLHYDPAIIEANRSYSVTAKILVENRVVFRSDTMHPVLTRGAGDSVEVTMVRMPQRNVTTGSSGSGRAEPALAGPRWVAEDIAGRGVMDILQSRIVFGDDGEAHGSGGCNAFRGRYERDGDALRIGPLASTRKACPAAIMDQEARFHRALEQVRRFRIENGLLYLLDDHSEVLVRLWSDR
jgi:putative lipoprotein